jgi:NAD(P)-dependent dehydrogenase (short-subunit alcohol dehydrogenase family)
MGLEKSSKKRIVLITGAGSGIGKATAIKFSRDVDTEVLIADVDRIAGKKSVDAIRKNGGRAEFFKVDISQSKEVRALAKVLKEEYGRLDILINNAAVEHVGTVTNTSLKDWERVIRINLTGLYLMSKYLIPIMIEAKKGSIVNTASISGLLGWPESAAYCTSKGGVVNLTREMAADYARYNIRVNCICPGTTKTSMISRLLENADDSEVESIIGMHPLNRFAEPFEIAEAIYFLASEDASFITGAILPVDGGYTAK